ncbi:MAG: flagellar hook assembly protein FlgD [Brucellaceae bacterium]|nr:flagellar hook assembly protein FlgD [Notoacmeibacter sp.]MCC0025506.1 flagellar hook assembly protein FlgD [Brucellaceae bacterium]
MTSVTAVTGNTQAAAESQGSQARASNMVNYDTFLQILVTQMKNQDPTEPMDASQYVSQLASFSNVEQSIQINNKLEVLLAASVVSQVDSIVDRTITSADGSVSGTVSQVKIGATGLVAILDSGAELPVTTGTVIGE